jgi:hypothetical protein
MFQGKKCVEKFIERVSVEFEEDPILFVYRGITLTDEEKEYLLYENFPASNRIYTLPGIISLFLCELREKIPEEIFRYYEYLQLFNKIVGQLENILSPRGGGKKKVYAILKTLLDDLSSCFYDVSRKCRERNNKIRKNRRSNKEMFQRPVDEAVNRYIERCDKFEEVLIKVITSVPPDGLRRLVGVLKDGAGQLIDVYDSELRAGVNSRGRVPVYCNPERLSEIKLLISDHIKPLFFQLVTARKRSMMYKVPIVDYEKIIDKYMEILEYFPYFLELESRIKPKPILEDRRWKVVIFPTGRMSSPYTKAITAKGKETRMSYGFYYHLTNVIILSGTADEMTEEGEIPETERVFFEYIFDTLTQNGDYIRDPVGVDKEKGNYYSVIKKRVNPELKKILEDKLDLRYHFTEDCYKFIMKRRGDESVELNEEIYRWFVEKLVESE